MKFNHLDLAFYSILTVLTIGGMASIVTCQSNHRDEFRDRCRARGGVPHFPDGGSPVCLRPEMAIDVGER